MRKTLCLAVAMASLSTISSGQTITETFGSGANAFTMEFVTIGNPGNAADTMRSSISAGSVAYTYNIGKYEVSRDMITKANSAGGLGITMDDMSSWGGNGVNRPATGTSWYEAAKFVNYLNTSRGGTAAYKFVGGTFTLWSSTDAGYNANNQFRNSLAKFVIASSDEWYKAAYGNLNGTWNIYPTGSDSAPTPVLSGTSASTAVYNDYIRQSGPADITNAGGLSPYGTMGQGGNVWEWNETAYDGSNNTADESREFRGGSWGSSGTTNLDSLTRYSDIPTIEDSYVGFRVAMIPEPSSLSLLVLGGVVLALRRRREYIIVVVARL